MMAELTTDELAWIKGASDALIAIRSATRDRLDDEQRRDIRFLADAFHNIGMVDGQRPTFAHMQHPTCWHAPRPSRRDFVRASIVDGHPSGRSCLGFLDGQAAEITREREPLSYPRG
ncbi:hypothetical protein AV944_17895 (plasmid) [Sphingomonas sp. LK11]|jgi:hypothetical protein|nr:hypothetical protein AV944_17895 [Sphingomonas sp. LK11]